MRLIQRYILSEFLKLLAIALGAFIALFMMVDLFENIDLLMKHGVPLSHSVRFFAWKLPFIIGQVSPIAVLVASLVSLGLLSKHGEITAIKAGGVRLLRAVTPLLIAGLAISVLVILMNEYVTPVALKKTDSFRQQWFGVQGGSFGKEGVWVRTGRGIFNVRQVDLGRERLYGLTLYEMATLEPATPFMRPTQGSSTTIAFPTRSPLPRKRCARPVCPLGWPCASASAAAESRPLAS